MYDEGIDCPHCKSSEWSDENGNCGLVPAGRDPNQFCYAPGCICWGGPDHECEACWLDSK